MQLPGRGNTPDRSNRDTELDPQRNAFPGSMNEDEEVSSDMEVDDEPILDEEDLEENDLTDDEADDIEWDEPPTEGTRKS